MKKESLVLTADGYLELEEELNRLKTVDRPEIIRALKDARAQGDLSENADYDAARAAQAQIEARIKELEYRLEHSEIASNVNEFLTIWLYTKSNITAWEQKHKFNNER